MIFWFLCQISIIQETLKIKNTIGEIIKAFATKGNVIIVGRGSVSICRDIPKSLHIGLVAPIEARIDFICKKDLVSPSEAEKRIAEVDHKRSLLRRYFAKNKSKDPLFDITFNSSSCSMNEMVQSTLKLMELRDLI